MMVAQSCGTVRLEAPKKGPAVKLGLVAQILPILAAITAGAAGPGEPGGAGALADAAVQDARADGVDDADDFVPRDNNGAPRRQVAVDHVEVRAANAAR